MHRKAIVALAVVAAVAAVATTESAGEALEPGSPATSPAAPSFTLGTAFVPAASARVPASGFELSLEGTATWVDGPFGVVITSQGTFTSRAPDCATGTFVDVENALNPRLERHFTCDDGTGRLTVLVVPEPLYGNTPQWNSTWWVQEGSGSYAGLRGGGSMRGELLGGGGPFAPPGLVTTWRSSLQLDTVAPTIDFASATVTRLRRTAGAYALKLRIGLRDDVVDNPVSYTLRVSADGVEVARRVGTARTEAVSMTLRIRPGAGVRIVRLRLTAEDLVGNAASVGRALRLRR